MTYYRLYFMDPDSGHIFRFEEFDVAEEDEAIGRAERACAAAPVELWSGRRKVRRLEPHRALRHSANASHDAKA